MDKNLLEILACPFCKQEFELANNELVCRKCQKAFPVEKGIPILLPEKSRNLSDNKQPGH